MKSYNVEGNHTYNNEQAIVKEGDKLTCNIQGGHCVCRAHLVRGVLFLCSNSTYANGGNPTYYNREYAWILDRDVRNLKIVKSISLKEYLKENNIRLTIK